MTWRVETFFVPGRPRPQGSMKFVKSKMTGKSVPLTNDKLVAWRSDIKQLAMNVFEGMICADEGCGISLTFTFRRPKCHYRGGKYSHLLRDDSPEHMLKTPDIDKLIRAVLDALTGVVFVDDSEVYSLGAHKKWGPNEGIEITVRGEFHAVQEG